jgi:hypothetical protein
MMSAADLIEALRGVSPSAPVMVVVVGDEEARPVVSAVAFGGHVLLTVESEQEDSDT